MNRRAPNVKTLLYSVVFVFVQLINSFAFAQEYDARIDVTFIKTDSSETRYVCLINYSNQPIELDVEYNECPLPDNSSIISVKDSSLAVGNSSKRGYTHYKIFGVSLDYISFSYLVIQPFSALVIPIKAYKPTYKDEVYFDLIVPITTSITLNNKKEEDGYLCKRQISFRRTFFGFTYKPAVYTKLKITPLKVNVNSTLSAKSGFSKDINKTTVLGLREYLSYFCE